MHQDFDGCANLYKYFVKQYNVDYMQLLGIAVISLDDVSGNKSDSFSPENHYYDSNKWYVLSKNDQDKVLNMHSSRNGGKNNSRSGRGGNNGKQKSNIAMLEKKVNNQNRLLSVCNTMAKSGLDNGESYEPEKEDGNRKKCVLTRQGSSKRSKKVWHATPQYIDFGELVNSYIIVASNCRAKIGRVEAATSSQNNEYTMEINNHADTTVLVSNCLPVHDFEISVDTSIWYARSGSVERTTISVAIAYEHPISRQVYMLMYHQVVHCKGLANIFMCTMQSRMKGVNINELTKFLAEDPDKKTYAIIVSDALKPNQPLIIP